MVATPAIQAPATTAPIQSDLPAIHLPFALLYMY